MGKTRVRIEMDDEQKILLKRSLNKNGEGIALPTQETYASFLMTSWPL